MIVTRFESEVAAHSRPARLATATASSMSAVEAKSTVPDNLPVAGL